MINPLFVWTFFIGFCIALAIGVIREYYKEKKKRESDGRN